MSTKSMATKPTAPSKNNNNENTKKKTKISHRDQNKKSDQNKKREMTDEIAATLPMVAWRKGESPKIYIQSFLHYFKKNNSSKIYEMLQLYSRKTDKFWISKFCIFSLHHL